jgi:acylaminoacyl-peptidase
MVILPLPCLSCFLQDWCVIEVCGLGTYDWRKFIGPSAEQMTAMYEKSAIAHSKKVKVPTLIALGMGDLRVPPSQGLEYYHILRSRGVPTKLLLYDDCDHPIGAVRSKADHWINVSLTWVQHTFRDGSPCV